MNQLVPKARLVLCALIVLAFFLPAYKGYSGLRFLPVALSEAANKSGVTSTDVLILLMPLLMIPLSAIGVYTLFVMTVFIKRIYLAMPLLFLVFFFTLLFRSPGMASSDGFLGAAQIGFYITALAACGLPFTKDPKRKSRRRRHRAEKKIQATA